MTSIDVATLARWRAEGRSFLLLDVREHDELEIASLPGALHVPMRAVPSRLAELDASRPVVVMCHHGIRSARVAAFLRQEGFPEVLNLIGGIDAWSELVDPGVPRY